MMSLQELIADGYNQVDDVNDHVLSKRVSKEVKWCLIAMNPSS